MTTEDMLKRWAAARLAPLGVTLEEIEKVRFEHEDGWLSDSGTGWPEENLAVVTTTADISHAINLPGGMEFLPEILKEILDAGESAA